MSVSHTERAPLLDQDGQQEVVAEHSKQGTSSKEQAAIIVVLLLGDFVANVDGTLVIAQTGTISSEFGNLASSEWLSSCYFLASCAAQPIIGKLSDIYGRKEMLLWCYSLFIVGNFLTGCASQMWQALSGRVIAGMGSAGMLSIVSILIADLVPIRALATWRSYVNLAATSGRSVGGPIGGALADTIGWRWSFYGQCPLTLIAFILVLWKLPKSTENKVALPEEDKGHWKTQLQKVRRIDFLGAITMVLAIVSLLLAIEWGSKSMNWASLQVLCLFLGGLVFGAAFLFIEKKLAKEPIFPIHLMGHRDIMTTYPVASFQTLAQTGLMYVVPLRFQIVEGASTLDSGTRLVPAVVGNAIGGLICGYIIHRTGRYKMLTLAGLMFACIGYASIIFSWRRSTSWTQTLLIFPGGFGNAVSMSTTFIALTAGVDPVDLAVAGAGLYQAHGIGATIGTCVSMSILQAALKPMLGHALRDFEGKDEIIKRSIEDISYARSLRGPLQDIVINCYVKSLLYAHINSLAFGFVAFLISLFWKEHRL